MAASQLVVTWNGAGLTTNGILFRNGTLAITGTYLTGGLDWVSVGALATDINNGFTTVYAVIVGEWGPWWFEPNIASNLLLMYRLEESAVAHRPAHRHSIESLSHSITDGGHTHAVAVHTHEHSHTHTIVVPTNAFGAGIPAGPVTLTDVSQPLPDALTGVADPVLAAQSHVTDLTVADHGAAISGPSGAKFAGLAKHVFAGTTSNTVSQVANATDVSSVVGNPITVIGVA